MRIDPASAASPSRLPLLDAARGAAVLAMIVYHFAWDLGYFGFIEVDVAVDLGWRIFARCIAGSFIFVAGVSLVLAARKGLDRNRFLRRLAIVAGAAVAITIVTWLVFPDTYIFFGILHHIALASVLALPFIQAPLWLVAAAAVASFLAPPLLAGPAFDHPALIWLGLASYFPRSNDFVPLLPWFGVTLAGIFFARVFPLLARRPIPALGAVGAWIPSWLLWAGRHSLAVYLAHQPILFGLTFLAALAIPPDREDFEAAFLDDCRRLCVESEIEAEICRHACACLSGRAKAEDLWEDLARQTLSEDDTQRYFALANECRAEAEQ